MLSKIIHKGPHYTACHVGGAHERLAVTSNKTGKGASLRADHPQFAEYLDALDALDTALDALDTALDAIEGDALCRALIRG